jgi:hypothetical protein
MAKDSKPLGDSKPVRDLNATAKQAVEQTKEQALGALDTYFDVLKKTVSSYPSGETELGEKLKSHAERNLTVAQEFVKKLSQAKDFQQVVRIQTEFMQSQFSAFGEQAKSFGEAYTKSMAGGVKMPFKNMS